MQTCLVLGAGATLANALHFHKRRMGGHNPPLDFTFFEKVAALAITVPAELKTYADATAGGNPFITEAGHPPLRMEEFFKELFSDFQDATRTSTTALAYEQLVSLYTRVLRDTTDWIGDDNKTGGPVGRLISDAAEVSDTLKIITFNHDLVIENEIVKRARLRRRWCIQQGYGDYSNALRFTKPSSSSGPLFRDHSASCDHSKPIVVLKLHGSLNWYVQMVGSHPSRSILTGASTSAHVHCTARRNVPHQFRFSRPASTKRGRAHWYTWPVIIPPVHNKEALIRNFVAPVWGEAAAALSTADWIICVGYSLPTLDVGAERLFKRAIASNPNLKAVDVVNPSPDSAARYASITTPKGIRWVYSIDRFLESAPFG
jgi:hypothetical protein